MALLLDTSSVHRGLPSDQNNVQPLDDKTAAKVFALYQGIFDKDLVPGLAWMKDEFRSVEACFYPWRDLDVRISLTEMEEVLNRTGVLQLRPIPEDCRILVVGCGNEPLTDAAGCALAPKGVDEPESTSYRKTHKHLYAITINPHLAHNPTLAGFFGAQRFPMLKNGQFDLIVIEGTTIIDTTIGRDELNRLLSATGRVVFNYGYKEGLQFSWEENSRNVWDEGHVDPPVVIEDLNIYESFNYPNETN